MFVALVFISTYISYKDLRTHRISNRILFFSLVLFLIISRVENRQIYLSSALFAALIAMGLFALGMGGGDVKLATVFALFYLPTSLNTAMNFFAVFSLVASVQLFVQLALSRSMSASIALAPAICGALIWCAR